MDRWDLILIGVALYIAVISLVRLMAKRRSVLIQQIHRNVEEQLKRQPRADTPSQGPTTGQEKVDSKEVA